MSASERPRRILGRHASENSGPTLVAVGGVHGNEPAGLLASERVLTALSKSQTLERGVFIALRGNLAALGEQREGERPRYVDHDLNRLFREDGFEPAPDPVEARDRDEIRACLRRFATEGEGPRIVLDLHTVSSPSMPFIAVEDSLQARRFAMGFPLPKVLGIEEVISGLLMDEATNRFGCIAMTVEGGQHDNPGSICVLEATVWTAMDLLGMLGPDGRERAADARRELAAACGRRRGHVYDMRYGARVRDPSFRAVDEAQSFVRARARRTVVATECGREIAAGESGLLFMINRQANPRPGDDAYFIVRRISRFWLGVSALLRRPGWLHRLLPKLLPGVDAAPGRLGELAVDPRVAAILKRQVFHLLGYRLVRYDACPGLSLRQRIHAGLIAMARSLSPTARSGPDRSGHPWLVRRRTLDVTPVHSIDMARRSER